MPSHTTILHRYNYDPLDCLIGLKSSVQEEELQRFYCKSRLASEIQGVARNSIVRHGDRFLAQQQREGDALETTLLVTDEQGSLMHAVRRCVLPMAYSPYGYRRAENGLTSLPGFNGERSDTLTGHYLLGNGHRAFNPVLMRFNSPDRLSPFGKGEKNAYAYCSGDPINRKDPTGNFSFPWMKNISPGFIENRLGSMNISNPWYKWSSMEVDIAKLHNGTSSPFTKSPYQQINVLPSSHPRFPKTPPRSSHGSVSQSATLKEMSADRVTGETWSEQPDYIQEVYADTYSSPHIVERYARMRMNPGSDNDKKMFANTAGAENFRRHSDKFSLVMRELDWTNEHKNFIVARMQTKLNPKIVLAIRGSDNSRRNMEKYIYQLGHS